MKKLFVFLVMGMLLSSCRLLHLGRFKVEKDGCPSNGRNVGAEKILAGDPKATRDAKKAKYKMGKSYAN